MGHDHTPAAVSLAAKLVERVSEQTRQILSCTIYTDFTDHAMNSDCPYPSVRPSSSTILTNFSQRSPVTFVGVSQRAASRRKTEGTRLTFPQEKQRIGMIILQVTRR